MAKLTEKQKRFVEEYLIDLNATQAAIRAGYKVDNAQQVGSENLSKLVIREAIEKALAERSRRTGINQDRVVQELARIAFVNITDIVMAIGRAGENGVLYASLQCAGRELASKGLGCLFGWKNLKAITLPGFSRKDSVCNGKLERKVIKAHERSRISKTLRKEGGGRFIDSALQLGWLPVRNYSDRFDPRAYALDGRSVLDKYGMYPDSCQDCYFSCTRRTKENEILPSWEECTMLGSNLGFFSLESVRILSDAVREEGLGIADTGALLSFF